MRKIKKRTRPRTVKLDAESVQALGRQEQLFREKFGRDPGPDDPVFFDPDQDTPQPLPEDKLTRDVTHAMAKAGIDPAMIYAYAKTGMLVTESNLSQWSEEDLEEYEAAIREFRERPEGKPQ